VGAGVEAADLGVEKGTGQLLHEGGYSIERTSSRTISFRHPRGWLIPASPRPPRSNPGRLATLNGKLR
jgi:hypothetical protein